MTLFNILIGFVVLGVLVVASRIQFGQQSKGILKWALASVLSLLIAGCLKHTETTPDSLIGKSLFRAFYSIPWTRAEFLKSYSQTLEGHNNGVPASIDQWFAKRLHEAPKDERKMIADFYARSPRSFWDSAIYKLNDRDQGRMIRHLIPTLRKASQEDAIAKMILIETLRIRYGLPKPGIWSQRYQAGMSVEDMGRLTREDLPSGIAAFENWWGDGNRWPINRLENPLTGTTLEIGAGSP